MACRSPRTFMDFAAIFDLCSIDSTATKSSVGPFHIKTIVENLVYSPWWTIPFYQPLRVATPPWSGRSTSEAWGLSWQGKFDARNMAWQDSNIMIMGWYEVVHYGISQTISENTPIYRIPGSARRKFRKRDSAYRNSLWVGKKGIEIKWNAWN